MANKIAPQKRIRFLLILFICALMLSGLTAIPLQWEVSVLLPFFKLGAQWGIIFSFTHAVDGED